MNYFYLIERDCFCRQIVPALNSSWQDRNLQKITELRQKLAEQPDRKIFGGRGESERMEVCRPIDGAGFRSDLWRLIVAEILLFAASELPELETPLESWAGLLGQELEERRGRFTPIQKAVLGTHDLNFGCFYRPENAGWNDCNDVRELAGWLRTLNPEKWTADTLTRVPAEDRDEELAYAREWLRLLSAMYQRAEQQGLIVVCEHI